MGVSPSRLLGAEAVSVTEYVYSGEGYVSTAKWRWLRVLIEWLHAMAYPQRLERAVTRESSEWSDTDREAVVAAMIKKRLTGSHGHPLEEAMSPDANPSSPNAKYRYVARQPSRDYAQQALTEAQENMRKQYPDADMSSLMWRVERVKISET